ncbi:MAG: LamG domain-containing protein [Abitibacteriaceae bacterium]|nr:LamG domain-containing protein [Abditibacteriaceae bacterium]MBV9864666.1 LamG domain-containing protein [Abditibacteriaceae bacterium]
MLLWLSCLTLPTRAAVLAEDNPILVPPWLEDSLVYRNSFDNEKVAPNTNIENIQLVDGSTTEQSPLGLFGKGLALSGDKSFKLRSPVFSPHKPFTLSFWWALKEDAKIDTGFNLFGLTGNGYIGHFVRGKGEWCALQRPTGVCQVYYFKGIPNQNLLYDGDLASSLNLKANVWHHTAAVFRAGSTIEIYTDGKKATETHAEGRLFRPEDNLQQFECGPFGSGGYLDELTVFDRALSADVIGRYYSVISQMRALT